MPMQEKHMMHIRSTVKKRKPQNKVYWVSLQLWEKGHYQNPINKAKCPARRKKLGTIGTTLVVWPGGPRFNLAYGTFRRMLSSPPSLPSKLMYISCTPKKGERPHTYLSCRIVLCYRNISVIYTKAWPIFNTLVNSNR